MGDLNLPDLAKVNFDPKLKVVGTDNQKSTPNHKWTELVANEAEITDFLREQRNKLSHEGENRGLHVPQKSKQHFLLRRRTKKVSQLQQIVPDHVFYPTLSELRAPTETSYSHVGQGAALTPQCLTSKGQRNLLRISKPRKYPYKN